MRPTRLRLEQLEDRSVPATYNIPWANASGLTLSFAPDGTDINGAQSNLWSALGGLGSDSVKLDILRAFQNWAVNSNINIGLVSDDGSAFDAPGQFQGDPRFGDIRIGGRALASDVGALTTPVNYFNTQSGNMMWNTSALFSLNGAAGTLDLTTVALHEAGHDFGLADNADPTSVMYGSYQGIRRAPSATDIAAVQALYGTRLPDAFEGATGNGTLATATAFTGSLNADISTTNDADVYWFAAPADGSTMVVQLRAAGLSLLQAQVQVLDATGAVVAQGAAQDVFHNDVALSLSNLKPYATYYVRVSGNNSGGFGVGSYQLSINPANSATSTSANAVVVAGNYTTFDTAAVLQQTIASVNQQIDYSARVNPDSGANVSFIRVHAPTADPTQPFHLVASVTSVDPLQDAQVTVFDANHNVVSARVLADGTGATVVQVDNAQPDSDYFICVQINGEFNIAVDFTTKDTPFTLGSTGTNSGTVQSATLTVLQSQVLYFVLSATGDSSSSVVMTIRDLNGVALFVLSATGGTTRSSSVFLGVGSYRVEMTVVAPSDGSTATDTQASTALTYSLAGCGITDPMGTPGVNATSVPPGSTPPPTTSTTPPVITGPTVFWTPSSSGDGSYWF